jgi:hypothetical protein
MSLEPLYWSEVSEPKCTQPEHISIFYML